MRIHHLIIGAKDKQESADFYCELLGYRFGSDFGDTGTGEEGIVLLHAEGPELLLVPFRAERLPNPQHIAFEVSPVAFEELLGRARHQGLRPRSHANLDSAEGSNAFEQSGQHYLHFYVLDPARLNVEILCRTEPGTAGSA